MNRLFFFWGIALIGLLAVLPSLDARGGRGGEGRAGGGASRSVNRSPTMSRTDGRQNRARVDRSAAHSSERRPSGNTQARNDVQGYLRNNPTVRNPSNLPDRGRGNRNDLGSHVRREVRDNRPGIKTAFNQDFWDRHHGYPSYYRPGVDLWKWGTAAGIGSWLGWQATPIYYDYDDSGYSYGGSSNYVETSQTITTTPISEDTEWLPLGVFALSKVGEAAATPQIYVQLALNKQGDIAGTSYNAVTNQTYELQGVVDSTTQRAAWKIADNPNSPIVETGLYNLTQSEAPIQVHFSNGTSQSMLLVRLEKGS